MKHIINPGKIITLFLISISSLVSAQQNDSVSVKKSELGVSLFTWYHTDRNKNLFPEPGLIYKHHFDAFTVKAFAGGFKDEQYYYSPKRLSTKNHYILRAGVEKVFFKGWLQFAPGVDLMTDFDHTVEEDWPEPLDYSTRFYGPAITNDIIINLGQYISANIYTDVFFQFRQKDFEDIHFTPISAFTLNYRF